jgi:hypothetical protein
MKLGNKFWKSLLFLSKSIILSDFQKVENRNVRKKKCPSLFVPVLILLLVFSDEHTIKCFKVSVT